jgi:hypothetical protein
MYKLVLITLLAALTPNASAQRMSAGPGFAPHFAPHLGSQFGRQFISPRSAFGQRSFADPIPFLTDSLYSDAMYAPGYGVAQPAVIVMQAPVAQDPPPVHTPAEPLLIELQGDRYVRISGEEASGTQMIDGGSASANRPEALQSTPIRESVPAILVFRDGHSEEVYDYTIASGILYARASYYGDGTSNRKVALSFLNLPETVAANRTRGVKFQLPVASNEVIVGP